MRTRNLTAIQASMAGEKYLQELLAAGQTRMTEDQGKVSQGLYWWAIIANAHEDLAFIAELGNLEMHSESKNYCERTIAELEPKFAALEPFVDEYLGTLPQ